MAGLLVSIVGKHKSNGRVIIAQETLYISYHISFSFSFSIINDCIRKAKKKGWGNNNTTRQPKGLTPEGPALHWSKQ